MRESLLVVDSVTFWHDVRVLADCIVFVTSSNSVFGPRGLHSCQEKVGVFVPCRQVRNRPARRVLGPTSLGDTRLVRKDQLSTEEQARVLLCNVPSSSLRFSPIFLLCCVSPSMIVEVENPPCVLSLRVMYRGLTVASPLVGVALFVEG